MDITKIGSSTAHIALMPDDLLVLAMACEWAADAWSDDGKEYNTLANPATEYTFRALACAFHGLAFAADATGQFRPSGAKEFDRDRIARAWKWRRGSSWVRDEDQGDAGRRGGTAGRTPARRLLHPR